MLQIPALDFVLKHVQSLQELRYLCSCVYVPCSATRSLLLLYELCKCRGVGESDVKLVRVLQDHSYAGYGLNTP
jgi:hypothetical protein